MNAVLGVDIGATKSHALIIDSAGTVLGFGSGGTGNHESVGYDGLSAMLRQIVGDACRQAGIAITEIRGAGFGLCGYDWESERAAHLAAVGTLGLECPVEIVNDALLGLFAGAAQGWGVSVTAGTSCNCWGRDAHGRYGRVIGMGQMVGEAAGGGELVERAIISVAHAYTLMGPATRLTEAFMALVGAPTPAALLEGYSEQQYRFGAAQASLVFRVAQEGDAVAQDILRWGGQELGNLALAVIRQLELQAQAFEVVQAGSIFRGSPMIAEAMARRIHAEAPNAKLVRLVAPPVVGAALLGMEQNGSSTAAIEQARAPLIHTEEFPPVG